MSCSTASLICIPHFFYNSDLLHKQAGPSPGKTGSGPRHAEILAGRAASDDVHRWQVGTIEFCDIPDMDHVRESQPSDFDGKRFDLACPQRGDAVMDRCQRKTADPIKETPHGGHQIIPSPCPEAVTSPSQRAVALSEFRECRCSLLGCSADWLRKFPVPCRN